MDQSCEACHSDSVNIDQEIYENFGVFVCYSCKDSSNLYEYVTKTQARNEFLLTDEELADSSSLPSISRKNPHNPRWSDMKLYLRRQLRDFSIKKHGSEEAIQDALKNRNESKTDRKSKQFLKRLKGKRNIIQIFFIYLSINQSTPRTSIQD